MNTMNDYSQMSRAELATRSLNDGIIIGQREARAEALEEAAQICEEFLRSFRGMAEDGDHFETLAARIRELK